MCVIYLTQNYTCITPDRFISYCSSAPSHVILCCKTITWEKLHVVEDTLF